MNSGKSNEGTWGFPIFFILLLYCNNAKITATKPAMVKRSPTREVRITTISLYSWVFINEMTPTEAQAELDDEGDEELGLGEVSSTKNWESKREAICDLEVFNVKRCIKECTKGSHIDWCLDFCD